MICAPHITQVFILTVSSFTWPLCIVDAGPCGWENHGVRAPPTMTTRLTWGAPSTSRDATTHPRGALVFMLAYLVMLALLWANAYLRLWGA